MATHEASISSDPTQISLRTLTQTDLNRLTRAFPHAKQMLARPEPRKVTHFMTLEFNGREKRLIDAAARSCGVYPSRLMYNAIFGLAEGVMIEERGAKCIRQGRRRQKP